MVTSDTCEECAKLGTRAERSNSGEPEEVPAPLHRTVVGTLKDFPSAAKAA